MGRGTQTVLAGAREGAPSPITAQRCVFVRRSIAFARSPGEWIDIVFPPTRPTAFRILSPKVGSMGAPLPPRNSGIRWKNQTGLPAFRPFQRFLRHFVEKPAHR